MITIHRQYVPTLFFILNFNSCFTNHIHWLLHPFATLHKDQSTCFILSAHAGYHWASLQSLKPMAESWQNMHDKSRAKLAALLDLHCAVWNSDHRRQQFTFLTVATDSTSWPCESHLNIFNEEKSEKREKGRERKEEKNILSSDWRDIQHSWLFMHTWSCCWQPWKLSNMDCCTEVSNRDRNQWQAPFDSQIMTSTLQANARHSPTSPTSSDCCTATKPRVRG